MCFRTFGCFLDLEIEVVIVMLKDAELFIPLFLLFIAVLVLFNARWIMKNKVKKEVENKVVLGVKIGAFLVAVISLVIIYYIR